MGIRFHSLPIIRATVVRSFGRADSPVQGHSVMQMPQDAASAKWGMHLLKLTYHRSTPFKRPHLGNRAKEAACCAYWRVEVGLHGLHELVVLRRLIRSN